MPLNKETKLCSWNWTCNLLVISLFVLRCGMCSAGQCNVNFWDLKTLCLDPSTHKIQLPTVVYNFFYLSSYCIFSLKFFDYWFSYIHLYTWSAQQDTATQHKCCFLRHLILPCSSLSNIFTSSHKGRWFRFSFHIWSAIPDFSTSLRHTAFRCSSSLAFSGQHVSPLYNCHVVFFWSLDLKLCEYNSDEDNSPNILTDKN